MVWNDELGESNLRSRDVWAGSWKRMGAQGRLNLAQRDTSGMLTVNHVFYHFGRYSVGCFWVVYALMLLILPLFH